MRQVINKLIREEDLYGAVDVGVLAGLAPGEAVLPHRPAHRDRRGHARHRRAGAQLRRDRPAAHQGGVGHRVGGRLRAQAAHAVPVVRPEHASPSCSARSTCCGTRPRKRSRACSSSGTTRRPRWSRASPAGATAASARSSRRCGATAACSRSGRSASTSTLLGRRRWPRTACRIDWYVYRHRDRRRGPAVGPHLAPASTRTSCGRTGRTPSPRPGVAGLPVDALLRLRGLHRLRHRARRRLARAAGGRQPGHRPGPEHRRRGARSQLLATAERVDEAAPPVHRSWARSAGPATATSPACGSGRSGGRSCRSPTPRASRPGPRSASAWRCPPAHESLAEYLDIDLAPTPVDLDGAARRLSAALAGRASTCTASAASPTAPLAAGGRHVVHAGRSEVAASTTTELRWFVDAARRWPRRARRHP